MKQPLLYLSEFFKNNRQVYYDKLNAYREKDDIEGWLKFYLEGVITTSEKAVDTAKKIIKLREKNTIQIATLGRSADKAMQLLNVLFKIPLVRIKDVEKIVNLENPNALNLVAKFEKLGILREITNQKRNRVYSYVDYVSLFSSS